MSTVLVNTDGLSKFQDGTQLADLGQKDSALRQLNIQLTDTDKKPILVPNRQAIDVVNDFSWYAGPKSTSAALNKVPCCFITEREQLLSSLISGGLYYLNASARGLQQGVNSSFVNSLLGKATEGGAVQNAIEGVKAGVDTAFKNLNGFAGGTASDKLLLDQHNLKSLEGIYFTKPTGFNYRFPLYAAPSSPTSNGFSEDSAKGILGSAVQSAQTIVDNISQAVNFAQPGVFIEKPQYFQGAVGRTEQVSFPLSNTIRRGTVSPIQQNYELLWLLAFQNRPYKTSFSRTPPPKIYTVNVPGQFSMPYAFIESMSVDFVGTVRKTKVTVPSGNGEGNIGSKVITTDVPEAYQVSLTFQSLLGEYGNTMISDAFASSMNGNKVTIGK